MKPESFRRLRLAGLVLAFGAFAACEDDPSSPDLILNAPVVQNDSIIGLQEPIRVVFDEAVDPQTALDPENFIVINQCTGLRVPGALRLAGDTLIFSPSAALPFLTPIAVRVQNILTATGAAFREPLTFTLRTRNPEVSDVSWETLNSPTNDPGTGINFVNRDNGFLTTIAGSVFRTTDGGETFAARFKDPNINNTRDIRAVSLDTAYMIGSPNLGTGSFAAFFRTTDSARTFTRLYTEGGAQFRALRVHKPAGRKPVMLAFGNVGRLSVWRMDEQTGVTTRFGPVPFTTAPEIAIANGGDLAANGVRAIAVGLGPRTGGGTFGVMFTSIDSGKTFTRFTGLPRLYPQFLGAGFANNDEVFVMGDTSTVLRVNLASGVVTELGAANGIPQTERDTTSNVTTRYFFRRIAFAPNNPQIGWMTGYLERGNFKRGVILQTRNGGALWTRQAVRGTPDNGLGFPPLGEFLYGDIQSLATDFAVLTGSDGFVAARKADQVITTALCSFTP